jgi:hypothetical protein
MRRVGRGIWETGGLDYEIYRSFAFGMDIGELGWG